MKELGSQIIDPPCGLLSPWHLHVLYACTHTHTHTQTYTHTHTYPHIPSLSLSLPVNNSNWLLSNIVNEMTTFSETNFSNTLFIIHPIFANICPVYLGSRFTFSHTLIILCVLLICATGSGHYQAQCSQFSYIWHNIKTINR